MTYNLSNILIGPSVCCACSCFDLVWGWGKCVHSFFFLLDRKFCGSFRSHSCLSYACDPFAIFVLLMDTVFAVINIIQLFILSGYWIVLSIAFAVYCLVFCIRVCMSNCKIV